MKVFEKDFRQWLFLYLRKDRTKHHIILTDEPAFFHSLPISMQWGVYRKFFEANGLFIMLDWSALK